MLDRMKIYADHIARILAPEEHPTVAAGVDYLISGYEDDGHAPIPKPGLGERIIDTLLGVGGIWVDPDKLDRFFFGCSYRGRFGMLAAGLKDVIDGSDLAVPDLLITDQRLILLKDLSDEVPVILWQCPLGAVAAVASAPRPLQHGRIIVSFQDGSFIALIAGILLRRRAKRIVAGWRAVRPA